MIRCDWIKDVASVWTAAVTTAVNQYMNAGFFSVEWINKCGQCVCGSKCICIDLTNESWIRQWRIVSQVWTLCVLQLMRVQ